MASHENFGDRKCVFFDETDKCRYAPRALLFDLEPRVVSGILQSPTGSIYSTDNIFLFNEGGGAGNNWASGYSSALQIDETILDMIDRETERCDSLEVL
jgi:tubulin gamma